MEGHGGLCIVFQPVFITLHRVVAEEGIFPPGKTHHPKLTSDGQSPPEIGEAIPQLTKRLITATVLYGVSTKIKN